MSTHPGNVPTDLLDEARLTELRELLGTALDDILLAWLDDAPHSLAAARSALEAGRIEDAIKAVHTLKGSSSNVGASQLSARARELERQLRAGAADCNALAGLENDYHDAARLLRARIHP